MQHFPCMQLLELKPASDRENQKFEIRQVRVSRADGVIVGHTGHALLILLVASDHHCVAAPLASILPRVTSHFVVVPILSLLPPLPLPPLPPSFHPPTFPPAENTKSPSTSLVLYQHTNRSSDIQNKTTGLTSTTADVLSQDIPLTTRSFL